MNIEEEILKKENEIKALNLTKGLNLNTKQFSIVIGVSQSTAEQWRANGFSSEYIAVPCLGKKKNSRIMYPIRKVAEWLVKNQIKTV